MRSKLYKGRSGEERIWLQPDDIEFMMEDGLRRAGLLPTLDDPVVDIEAFIERHLKVHLDQYAELDPAVLGLTEFESGANPRVSINRDLTGAVDDDDTDIGKVGRWRATLAHEASHVLMHRMLFDLDDGQAGLFGEQLRRKEPQRLLRCMKKNVLYRGGVSDWREVQANMGMAALLMPRSFFRELVRVTSDRLGVAAGEIRSGSLALRQLAVELAPLVKVSRQAATIRLETLKVIATDGQGQLSIG